jgi:NADPH:quinone reductase-like Zn-dependent oxidoreductase
MNAVRENTPDEGNTSSMLAVVTTGIGDYDRLMFTEVAVPKLTQGEVLLKILAAGVKNTDINTRLGWYSSSVTTGTIEAAFPAPETEEDGGWNGATLFPIIQGTDCCGRVVAVADGRNEAMIGPRVLVRACAPKATAPIKWCRWVQILTVPLRNLSKFRQPRFLQSSVSGLIPNLPPSRAPMRRQRTCCTGQVSLRARVLITGASGGVRSAAVQLAKRRGALVTGVAVRSKLAAVRSIGADHAIKRDADLVTVLGKESINVVVDNVGGSRSRELLNVLKRGSTYVASGAIASPHVDLDLWKLYLKNLSLLGCTA